MSYVNFLSIEVIEQNVDGVEYIERPLTVNKESIEFIEDGYFLEDAIECRVLGLKTGASFYVINIDGGVK